MAINSSSVAATSSGSSSVSSFLQGLWASSVHDASETAVDGAERAHYPGVPTSLISDVLAPLSFGAEPKSWPLQRLDQDVVNAAFQLVPMEVSSSRITVHGPESNESRQVSGSKRAPSRVSQSAVRHFLLDSKTKFARSRFASSHSSRIKVMSRNFMYKRCSQTLFPAAACFYKCRLKKTTVDSSAQPSVTIESIPVSRLRVASHGSSITSTSHASLSRHPVSHLVSSSA